MRVELKTVTPVHVGSGGKYGGAEIFRVREGYARTGIRDVVSLLEGRAYEDFLYEVEEPGFSLQKFMERHPLSPPARYTLKSSIPHPPGEVREIIRTGFDIPYIPGSTVKGAIRTALLWKACRDDPSFPPERLYSRNKRMIGKEIFEGILSTNSRRYDPKYDLLRFLEVSDFMPVKHFLYLEEFGTYSMSRNGIMAPKPFTIPCETLFARLEGTIRLSPEIEAAAGHRDLSLLEGKLPLLGLKKSDIRGLSDPLVLQAAEEKMTAHLRSVMRQFIEAALLHDLRLVSGSGAPSPLSTEIQTMQKKHAGMDLLRVGFSIGTTYQTVMDLIEEKDPDLASAIITDMKLGRYPRSYDGEALDPPYPKSIEFIRTNGELLMPGWVEWLPSS
ncbi:hypothetical protein RJ53_09410 [Methanocalculus chunghsingensis]|uniref:CRISPR system Cms protein Csm5 n=1 Tax=Methanocalculus chunghsingensis TaxID=156457 RepID=A0A8J7WB41_9EURY|nr:type III-A CRISPR-associated RAMP protein Csm5 [Methanocalculus chunghsingensis]MBR1369680.1 hypothetical protein [Methanocalculus chunghsingensis]